MPKIEILNDTYKALGKNRYGYEIGTVKVALGHTVVETFAQPSFNEGHSVAGFIGRYATSQNPWRASVSGVGEKLYVSFGRDDRSGRFNKRNAISWEPETYAKMGNPEFWVVADEEPGAR